MKNSLTMKKTAFMLAFSVAILLLVLTVFLGVGIKNTTNLTALAEGEIVLEEGGDLADLNVTKVGGEELTLWGDAEYTITSKRGAGETLIAVYATYTTGRLSGSKVMLYEDATSGNYVLYGVSGNFILTGEWTTNQIQITWNIPYGTLYLNGTKYTSGDDFNQKNPTYYGVGIPEANMPNVRRSGEGSDANVFWTQGAWQVSGYRINQETMQEEAFPKEGESALKYIPWNATRVTCYSPYQDIKDYTRDKAYEPNEWYTISQSNDAFEYRTIDSNSISGGQFTVNNYTGFGFYKNAGNATNGYLHSGMSLSVRFDGALRQLILSSAVSQVKITVTGNAQVGVVNSNGASGGRACFWWGGIEEGIGNMGTKFSFGVSGGKTTSTHGGLAGGLADNTSNSASQGCNANSGYNGTTSWYTASYDINDTLVSSVNYGNGISCFRVAFRACFYTSGGNATKYCQHYALISSLKYKVEGLDAEGNSTFAQDYELNLNGNDPNKSSEESEALSVKSFSNSSVNLSDSPWTYDGYEFDGWSTDVNATTGDKDLALTYSEDPNITYYAIWQKRKYTYLEYDIYSDGTNYAGLVRSDTEGNVRVGVYEDGDSVSVSDATEGNNSYVGFGDATAYSIRGISSSRSVWSEWGENNPFSITAPTVVGFVRELNAPTINLNEATYEYGNSLNLADHVSYSHDLGISSLNNAWLRDSAGNGTFEYVQGAPILTQVSESANYKFESEVTIAIESVTGSVELSKITITDAKAFTITPVELEVDWTLDGDDIFNVQYSGVERVVSVILNGIVNYDSVEATLVNNVQTNVGDYVAEITSINNDNYIINDIDRTKDYSITTVELQIVWYLDELDEEEDCTATYTGLPHVMSVEITGEVNEEEVTATLSDFSATMVGTYTASIVSISSSNYVYDEENLQSKQYVIAPKELTVTWLLDGETNLSMTYTGSEHTMTTSIEGIVNGEDVVPTLANNVQTNVGNYTAEITALDSSNYVVNEGDRTKDYAITAVELEVVWTLDAGDVFSVQYTGFEHVVAVAISGMVNGESVEATLANNAQTNVGNYTAKITALDSSNYVVNEGDRTKDYAIEAVELEVVWTLDEGDVFSVQYDGLEHVVAVALSGMVNGESVVATVANNAQTNVGNYTAEITALDSSNYVVNEGDGTKDYAIEAVELQITWNFDGGELFTTQYDKQEHVANVVLSGMVNGESVEANIVNNKQTDAGDYTAEITGISSSNYYLAGEVTKDFTIEQLMVGLTWSLNGSASFERIFNGGTYSATAKATGVIAGDGCTITLGGTNSAVEVGEYTVYAESLSNPNYVLPIENSQDWSIKPLAVNLSWNNLGYIYNGEVQSIEATINNIRGSYTCEIEYEGNEETQAGNYTATIIGLNSNNYTLTGATGSLSYDWSIAPRVISLAWDEVEFEYNKTIREVVASVTNLVSGDSVALEYQTTGASYEVSGVAGIGNVAVNAGTYTTKVVGLDNTNYTLEGTTGLVKENWSIAQKVVTIDWENVNYTYNKENRSITASVSNMVSGDDIVIEYTTTGASYEVSGVDGVGNVAVNAGAYLTEIIGISNVNYTLDSATNLSTEWGIAQKVVGLTWSFDGTNEFTTTYNGASHEVEVVLVGVEEGDIVEAIIDNASQTNAESYVAEVVLLSNANYSLPDETTQEYVINKRELTAIWFLDGVENQTSVLYNGEEHVATATLSNVVSGESVNIIGYVGEVIVGDGTITNGNTATDSSTYKTSISGLSDENNYKLAETSLSFQWGILTQELSISFENNASTYNGQAQGVTAIISGVTASDIVNITFATTTSTAPSISAEIKDGKYYVYFNAVNTGDYTAVISAIEGENSANYQLPEESDSEFSIAPRVITLAWNVEAYVYNKQNKEVTASASNIISGDEINFEYKTTGISYEVSGVAGAGNVAVNAGEYLTEVIAEDNANYVLDESADLTKEWSISAKLVDAFTWSPASVVYNANVQSVSAQVASGATTDLDGKIYDGDALTLSYVGSVSINEGSSQISANEATNAGEYIVRISSIGNQNYYIGTEEATFVIGKAQITIYSTSSWSKVYDKNASYLAYNHEGVIEGTAVTLSASYDDVNAGARALQFTLAGQESNNYFLTFNGLTPDTDYVQSGKEYTIRESVASIAQKSVIAEGNTSKVFDGTTEVNAFTIAESYIEEGDVINVTGAYDSALVGSVGIALQIDNPNYLLANTSLQGEITHKALSVEWTSNNALYTYNGELQGVEAVVNGMVEGYEENVYVSGAVEGVLNGSIATKKAGDYSVTLSLNSTSNYTLAGVDVSASWSIAKKALGIVWSTDSLGEMDASDNVLGWAGFLCQYAKVERFVEANLTGIVGNDDVQPVVFGNKATEAGDYNANVTGIAGVDKDNYELPEITAQEWSIVRAIITNVEMSDASYVYDKTTHGVYLSTTTTQFGDAIDVVYSGGISGSEAVDTGIYNIVATLNAGANYQPMTLTAVMEISKADVTGITLQGVNAVYDGTMKRVVLSGNTTIYGDELEVTYALTGTTAGGVSVSEVANGMINAGNYQVSATLSDNLYNNYNATTLSAEIVISAREIIVDWSFFGAIENSVYDGNKKGVTLTVSNIIAGDDVKAILNKDNASTNFELVGNFEYTHSAINALVGSSYSLTIVGFEGEDSSNYVAQGYEASAEFNIGVREVSIIGWSDGTKVYGLNEEITFVYAKSLYTLTPIFAEGNIIEGDEGLVDVIVSGNEGRDAGEYIASANIEGSGNYKTEVVTKEWSIEAKEVDLVWDTDVEKVYNGTVQTITATIVGIIKGDVANIKYSSNSGKDAGSYNVTASSLDNKNYKIATDTKRQSMVINPASIQGVELLDKEIVFDGNSHVLEVSKTTTQFGDKINVSFEFYDADGKKVNKNKVSDVGIYTVKAILDAGKNYEEATLEAVLTIKSAVLETPVQEGEKAEVNIESDEGFMPGTIVESKTTSYTLTQRVNTKARLGSGERVAVAYEISVVYENEESVLNGSTSVKMLIPEELRSTDFRVVNLSGDEETELEYVIEGDYVVVETTKLDTFLFIYEPEPEAIVKAYSGWLAVIAGIALVILVALLVTIFLKKTRTINFVSNDVAVEGGSVAPVKGRFGSKVNLPTPKAETMFYEGWYSDENCTQQAGPGQIPTKTSKLYAKTSNKGKRTKMPQSYVDGMSFEGWYQDEACTKKANVKKMGGKNVTLYAKWGKKKDDQPIYPWEF